MDSLKQKVVLVTGASSGIGRGTAVYFAKLGSKLILNGRNEERLQQTKNMCVEQGLDTSDVICVSADICVEKERQRLVDTTINTFNKLDVLINNAGIGTSKSITSLNEEEFMEIVKTNVVAPFRLANLCLSYLKDSKGNIVNVSSVYSLEKVKGQGRDDVLFRAQNLSCIPTTNQFSLYTPNFLIAKVPIASGYCMSKAALDCFTKNLALELAPFGVRVNSVNPGWVLTELVEKHLTMSKEELEKFFEDGGKQHPLGRIGYPEDVAKAIAVLASDLSDYVTGQILFPAGGRNCKVY